MEINAVVSENARRLREEKRLTLDEAARLTGGVPQYAGPDREGGT